MSDIQSHKRDPHPAYRSIAEPAQRAGGGTGGALSGCISMSSKDEVALGCGVGKEGRNAVPAGGG